MAAFARTIGLDVLKSGGLSDNEIASPPTSRYCSTKVSSQRSLEKLDMEKNSPTWEDVQKAAEEAFSAHLTYVTPLMTRRMQQLAKVLIEDTSTKPLVD